jgi:hypothetical protein
MASSDFGGRVSRSTTEEFLIGQSCPETPMFRLPSQEDTLRLISYQKQKQGCGKKSLSDLLCPTTKSKEAKCFLKEGCVERNDFCPIYSLKVRWMQAGIETISDLEIKRKIIKLYESYQKVRKKKTDKSKKSQENRDNYMREIKKTFSIMSPGARDVILSDSARNAEDKAEDIAFLDDYVGLTATRKARMTARDVIYDSEVLHIAERYCNTTLQ